MINDSFDTGHHGVLLQRLHLSFGIESSALEWMTFYLTDRQQSVCTAPILSQPLSLPVRSFVKLSHVTHSSPPRYYRHLNYDIQSMVGMIICMRITHRSMVRNISVRLTHQSMTPEVLISSVSTFYDPSQ